MSIRDLAALLGATALLGAGASTAHAETAKGKPIDLSVRGEASALAPGAKSLKWDARKGRWGLTFNLEQPDTRDVKWNDVEAGAYYRITPSLRVGGAVALGEKDVAPEYKRTRPEAGQPRVRLETAFKF